MIRLICIQTLHPHWASHSGYHHFLSRLPADINVELLRIERRKVVERDLVGLEKIWFRLAMRWAKKRLNPWTTEYDFLTELRQLSRIRSLLKSGDKIIVHFLDGEIGLNFLGALRCTIGRNAQRLKLVASYHQPGPLLAKILPRRERIKALDMVLTVGRSQLPFFNDLPPEKKRFVAHGIDTDYYCPSAQSVDAGRISCLTVGHWLRDFDALEAVIRRAPEEVTFRIVAGQQHVERFRSMTNTELYSEIDDDELLRLYRESDIGLMPLQDSTANNGLLEMMACGLPIITTRVGSVNDYLPECCGILLDANEPDRITAALNELSAAPVVRSRLGTAARQRAVALDWSVIAREMTDLYREL
jgi:glycosyltransferase involved in cell wall biosynthesis